MSKKISIFLLSVCLALAVTLGVSAHTVSYNAESEVTMCDMDFGRVSF